MCNLRNQPKVTDKVVVAESGEANKEGGVISHSDIFCNVKVPGNNVKYNYSIINSQIYNHHLH